MEQALSDVTVLDLGQVIAMPFCTMLLADLGARVIKVESRERGRERVSLGIKRVRDGVEERVPAAQYRERNKLAITLELKTAKGVELFKELVRHADVVTENFSVGTMDRLGLGYDELRQSTPASSTPRSPPSASTGRTPSSAATTSWRRRSAATCRITGFPDNPPTKSGQSISDYYAGMLCAFSIVSALHYRHRTGHGQRIDMALLDSLVVALDNLGERYTVGGEILTRSGNVAFTGSSTGVYHDDRRPRGRLGRRQRRRLAPLLRDHRPRRPDERSRVRHGGGAARPTRRDRGHRPGVDVDAAQGRGGAHPGDGGRARGARQQRGGDGRRSPGGRRARCSSSATIPSTAV